MLQSSEVSDVMPVPDHVRDDGSGIQLRFLDSDFYPPSED
jgi:hypothetical protein